LSRLLIDLSAWARSGDPDAAVRWQELVEEDRLICHPVFALECLHNAINPPEYAELRRDLDQAFAWFWPDEGTAEIAMQLQKRMATRAPCGQRVKTADLLTAALALQHGVGVLHYDSDYDEIQARGDSALESEWLAERGSLGAGPGRSRAVRSAYRKSFQERMVQLQDDEDLVVWPHLIEWLDRQLEERNLPLPPPPAVS
jgi:predicted nucleic acid-binding protein